jgi:hypothetical protein
MHKRVKVALKVMKDCQPHCMECLAKQIKDKTDSGNHLWKLFEDEGYELVKPKGRNSAWKEYCSVCERTTSFRQLVKPVPIYATRGNLHRTIFTKDDKERIWKLYNKRCPIFGSSIAHYGDIEIDHRSPAKIISEQETKLKDLTDEQVVEKYMPLYKHINQVKRNKCSTCLSTKKRPEAPLGIKFWYQGGEDYTDDVNCQGCAWAYPEKWGKALNKKLNE